MKQLVLCLLAGVLTLGIVADARAQQIVRRGDGDVFLDYRIDGLLRTRDFTAVQRDTTIARGDTIRTSLLVLDARVYLEGTVLGDVVGVDSELFVRPGARIEGDLVNIGGGLYPSELAEVGGRWLDLPRTPYTVRREGGTVVIHSLVERDALVLDGLAGFHVPEYNRVDGLNLDWGATYRFRTLLIGVTPGVRGQIGYRTERGALAGGGSAFLERGDWTLEGGWLRDTRSNDRWIRGDLRNSLDFIVDGGDMRNYHETDVAFGELRRLLGDEPGRRYVILGLRLQQEEARSLRTGNPWTAFGDDTLRVNPAIDPGRVRSLIPFVDAEWLTPRTATEARLEVETGWTDLIPQSCPAGATCDDEVAFSRLRLDSEFAMQALLDHTLEIELQFMLPLAGGGPLPRQRWGMLGGSGTIRTVPDAAFFGDHLAYSETEYAIPFRRLRLPFNVVPELELLHLAGLAWTAERDRDFIQNVGARINVWALFARYLVDPAQGDGELTFGLSWPFDRGHAWQE